MLNVEQDDQTEVEIGKKDQYRSSLVAFQKLLPKLKQDGFGPKHEGLLRLTPFWPLYDAYNKGLVSEVLHKKSDKALLNLIRRFDIHHRAFNIGGKYLKFTPQHVSDILGFPNEGKELKLRTKGGKKHRYATRNFAGVTQLHIYNLMPVLSEAVKGETPENIRDTVWMVCLHLCMTLLFANTGNSIGWFIVNWVGNLVTMANYNWARAIHEFLMHALTKKQKRPSSVTGCTILLLVMIDSYTYLCLTNT